MTGPSFDANATPVVLGKLQSGQFAFTTGKYKKTMSMSFEYATFTLAACATMNPEL